MPLISDIADIKNAQENYYKSYDHGNDSMKGFETTEFEFLYKDRHLIHPKSRFASSSYHDEILNQVILKAIEHRYLYFRHPNINGAEPDLIITNRKKSCDVILLEIETLNSLTSSHTKRQIMAIAKISEESIIPSAIITEDETGKICYIPISEFGDDCFENLNINRCPHDLISKVKEITNNFSQSRIKLCKIK